MIPKIIHQVWLNIEQDPMPLDYQEYCAKLQKDNPDFEYILWTDTKDLNNWDLIKKYINDKYPLAFIVDLVRAQILEKYGGIYVDIDVISKKPLKDLYEKVLDHNNINSSTMLEPRYNESEKNFWWTKKNMSDNWFIASPKNFDFDNFLKYYEPNVPACFLWQDYLESKNHFQIPREYIGPHDAEFLYHIGKEKWKDDYKNILNKRNKRI